MSGFRHRGVVEGFYGTPWSDEDRLWLVERIGDWGMNRFVYAPKDDPLHRSEWRTPYPPERMRAFAELVRRGAASGVDVGFGLSPGLSIHYAARQDRDALVRKLVGFREIGARFLCLALDDVPSELVHDEDRASFDSLAEAHVSLTRAVRAGVGEDALLWVVPSDYLGVAGTDYLEALGEGLPREVEIGWTGRTTVSPTIRAEEAAIRAAALRRPLLVWDNTPVADGPMRPMLHLGPYTGRAADLATDVSGILLNPMQHARASAIALYTAARFLENPAAYDPEAAWEEAIALLGAGAVPALACFARAHRFSALRPNDRDAEIEDLVARLREATRGGADARPVLRVLRAALTERSDVSVALHEGLADRRLLAELAPWIEGHARETRRMESAVSFLETLCAGGPRSRAVLAFFGMQGRLTREPPAPVASYGPRRVVYPQLASMRDDTMGFGADPVLYRDRCLSDELITLAEEIALDAFGGVPEGDADAP